MSLSHSLRREAEPYASRLERLSPSSKRTHPVNVRNPPPSNNFLANALNQTFQINSTSAASHVPTTPLSVDSVRPVGNAIISPTVKSQYKDFGVQKNLNFTRNTTVQPSEDLSSCIMRLEAENRDLRAQVETHKQECEVLRETLRELNRQYNPHHHHHPPPPPGGPSNFDPHPPSEFATHPRWRMRNIMIDSRFQFTDVQEPEHPPIETLPVYTHASPDSMSTSPHWRTPIEARDLKMRARGDGQSSRTQPYPGPQQHGQRRGPAELTNGRRRRGKLRGPPFGRIEKPIGSPAPPNSSATVEAGDSGTSPRIDAAVAQDHDKTHDKGR